MYQQRSDNRVEYLDTDTFVVSVSRYFSKIAQKFKLTDF